MSVRRRVVKERTERTATLKAGKQLVTAELSLLALVANEALAEGLTTMTNEEFAERVLAARNALTASPQPRKTPSDGRQEHE